MLPGAVTLSYGVDAQDSRKAACAGTPRAVLAAPAPHPAGARRLGLPAGCGSR